MALPLFKAEEAYLYVSPSPSLFSHSGSQLSCSLILSEILLRLHGNQDKKSGPSLLLLQEPDLWEVCVPLAVPPRAVFAPLSFCA